MVDEESFEEKLQRWTLNDLKVEITKTRIYSQRKRERMATRIAELQFGKAAAPVQNLRSEEYIATARLDSLRNLHSAQHDLKRLIRICEEINSSWRHSNLIAVGALTRILLDHVPPIFGHSTFAQVVATSPRSSKSVFEVLEQSSRKISDGLMHQTIREKETLPTDQQVNFSPNVDLLLAEVVRALGQSNAQP